MKKIYKMLLATMLTALFSSCEKEENDANFQFRLQNNCNQTILITHISGQYYDFIDTTDFYLAPGGTTQVYTTPYPDSLIHVIISKQYGSFMGRKYTLNKKYSIVHIDY